MQQFLSRFRLQTKLLAGIGVLFCVLFITSAMIRIRLTDMHEQVDVALNERHPIELLATHLDAHLDDAVASLGLYLSVRNQEYADDFHNKLDQAYEYLTRLQNSPLIMEDSQSAKLLVEIRQNLDLLSEQVAKLLKLTAHDETIFPGLAYANRHLNPLSREITQILTQMLHAEPQGGEDDRQLLLLKGDLRYYWVNVMSGIRGYLASRSDSVLKDTALYLDAARHELGEIRSEAGSLSLEDEEALARLESAMDEFVSHWQRLQVIHTSDNWRTDSYLMRTEIGPLFERIETQFETLIDEQHEKMGALSGNIVTQSRRLARQTDAMLLFGVIIGIGLSWGISRIFSRPIKRIAEAMERIAGGDADLSQRLDADGRDEIAQLASSFNTFVEKTQQSAEEERALSALLRLSHAPTELRVFLNDALQRMIETVTWLALQPKGGIFLCSEENGGQLELAAASGEVVFASCVDEHHDIRFEAMQPHGHYATPIKSGDKVLGVLILYLPEGHMQSENEQRFLRRIAEVLGLGIGLRQAHADLLTAKQRAEAASDQLTGITANIPGIIYQCHAPADGNCQYTYVSPGTAGLLGNAEDDPINDIQSLFNQAHADDRQHLHQALQEASRHLTSVNVEYRLMQRNGATRWILCNAVPRRDADAAVLWDGLLLDITDRKSLEVQLLQAQKLESVGQLAAGIAHEINTPTQYVQDNTHFLQEAFGEYHTALTALRHLRDQLPDTLPDAAALSEVDRVLEASDIDYLAQDIPEAISQSLDGLHRIASIVSAMKEFTHPGSADKQPVDINGVIDNIVTVSRNEWKYVAELETDLTQDLPTPPGYRDKLGQVFLNLIVNAAHAIGDEVNARHIEKGHIRIRTARRDNLIEIRVSDDGPGISESIQQKIFDPFFTTKAVGKGTGQGLSIARSVVVDQHQGSLTLESSPGKGTTFIIQLPLEDTGGDDAIAA